MVSIADIFPKHEAPIYVIGDEDDNGFFAITSNDSPAALGDLKAETAEAFFEAVDLALQQSNPQKHVVILVSDQSGDVQERTYAGMTHAAA